MPEIQGALQNMLARRGKTLQDFSKNSHLGKVFRQRGVSSTPELVRVLNIPRRVWKEDSSLDQLVADLTDWLRIPGGTMTLRPVQAKAIEELHDHRGLLSPIRVGGGKTLVSMLAPVVLGVERPLLLIPAKLREKTKHEFALLRRHWLFHPRLKIMSYELLSRDGGYELLEKADPDLIICDEAHRLAHTTAGCTRKARRWQAEHPETRWAFMSGTITTRSLRDYAHLAKWSLRDWAPVPLHGNEVADWSDCIDVKVEPNRRLQPGALLGMCNDEELDAVAKDPSCATDTVRRAYKRRFVETPGVVATDEKALGASLEISHIRLDLEAECSADFHRLREDWQTPDGVDFSEAVDLWRHSRALVCGLFHRWDPPAPEDWMLARREWNRFVRQILSSRRKGIDTMLQVAKACEAGELERDAHDRWKAIRGTFEPRSVAVWRHQKTLELAAKWLDEAPGIVWTEHVHFAKELSRRTGLPYFGEGGVDASGTPIEATPQDRVVASIQSIGEGHNLQRWSRCLMVSPPANGKVFEQCLGRCHREGQKADEVTYTLVLGCLEQWAGVNQARQDAAYVESTTGAPQKLLYADSSLPTPDRVFSWGQKSYLWRVS